MPNISALRCLDSKPDYSQICVNMSIIIQGFDPYESLDTLEVKWTFIFF